MNEAIKLSFSKLRDHIPVQAVSEKDLELLADHALTQKDFERITQEIYKFYKLHALNSTHLISKLIAESDDSPYSLGEWIRSMVAFYQWLDKRNSSGEFPTMLGYINCCIDSNENKLVERDLVDLLYEMLEDFGFKGESKCR